MIGKVWIKTKNKNAMGKENTVSTNFWCEICILQISQSIFLQLKESGWEGFIERLSFDRNTPYKRRQD